MRGNYYNRILGREPFVVVAPWATKQRGFTLVELLIVIVVIGILAAITIISYSGITDKAHTATLSSDLAQNANLLAQYNATQGNYPADQASAGLKTSDGVTLTYVPSGNGYCLQAVGFSQSYYITNDTLSRTTGTCPSGASVAFPTGTGNVYAQDSGDPTIANLTNLANGDLVFAFVFSRDGTITVPSGWTTLGAQTYDGAGTYLIAYLPVPNATAVPASYTWGATNNRTGFIMFRVTGASLSAPPTLGAWDAAGYGEHAPPLTLSSMTIPSGGGAFAYIGSFWDDPSLIGSSDPTLTSGWARLTLGGGTSNGRKLGGIWTLTGSASTGAQSLDWNVPGGADNNPDNGMGGSMVVIPPAS